MAQEDTSQGEYLLAEAALPGRQAQKVGILLLDSVSDSLHSRFRRDFEAFAGEEADWFANLTEEISAKSQELGGSKCLEWMESTLSHALRISARATVPVDDYDQTAQRLYLEHIRPTVLPFRTHLPEYTLESAISKFGKQMDVRPEGWLEVWTQIPLADDMFVIRIKDHSMEPIITAGSLCVFTRKLSGSWDGKVVLMGQSADAERDRFTIRLYPVSANPDSGREAGLHEYVTDASPNPEFESGEVASAGKIRVIAELLFMAGKRH